jgi:hypothetical protein
MEKTSSCRRVSPSFSNRAHEKQSTRDRVDDLLARLSFASSYFLPHGFVYREDSAGFDGVTIWVSLATEGCL